jgi:spermidine dehydrogenase
VSATGPAPVDPSGRSAAEDIALGLDRSISRRDFLNGVALAVGGGLPILAPAQEAASAAADAASASAPARLLPAAGEGIPPAADFSGQTFAAAAHLHARRDGAARPVPPPFEEGGETADLVVVGAGISGLAAAFLYRQHAGPQARVLLLDALSEPGGHAQRNEFVASNGRRLIGYGGSETMDSPSLWSPAARQLIRDIGIDLGRFEKWYDKTWLKRHGLATGALWFDAAHWGESRLVRPAESDSSGAAKGGGAARNAWVAALPVAARARADLAALLDAPRDPFPRLTRSQKRARLADLSYDQFLVDQLGVHPDVPRLLNHRTRGYLGVGTDAASALDAYAMGLPGFAAMRLGPAPDARMSPSGRQLIAGRDEYIHHFPDGNAGIVRALLHRLVPASFPEARDIESLVLARRDDAALDVAGAPVRLRLSSSVVDVRHVGGDPARAQAVDVAWADARGAVRTVRARHVVLACFHRVLPFICPELPGRQVAALDDQVKVPLLYGTVLLRNWQAFSRAGIADFKATGGLWDEMTLDFPVSMGAYRFPDSPDEPILLHLSAVILAGPKGAPEREQCAAGRRLLQGLAFVDVERDIRATLNAALGPFGFDAANDIEAITLNRWAHGYAYEYMRPWDAYWPEGPLPVTTARRGWGRIAIANADAGAYAYAHGAIDQATRAVSELLPHAKLPEWWRTPGPSPRLLGLAR